MYLRIKVSFALALIFFGADGADIHRAEPGLEPPTRHGFSQNISSDLYADLEELARFTAISYCVGNTGIHQPFICLSHCKDFPNYQLVTTFGDGLLESGVCGYIAVANPPSPPRTIVVFRGTYSIPDTAHDVLSTPATYHPYWVTNGTCVSADCQTHLGFATAWNSSRPVVLETLGALAKSHPEQLQRVDLLGHSMGGAVAGLAALELQANGLPSEDVSSRDRVQRPKMRVTTFGEPRWANAALAQHLDEVFPWEVDESELIYRRVTHRNDPVPLLPWEEFGWKMHGGEIFIDSSTIPPAREDVRRCLGPQDPSCIEGSADDTLIAARRKEHSGNSAEPITAENMQRAKQLALEEEQMRESGLLPKLPKSWRIWQLLFAHREYFWKIGLCLDLAILREPEHTVKSLADQVGSLEL